MSYEPVAYVDGYNGAMLCPKHGEQHAEAMRAKYGDDDETIPTPIMEWDEPLDVLQTCDHGHPFCGNCGSDWFGVTERRTSRTWKCGNCGARARFLVDGRVFSKWACGDGHWHQED